MKTYGPSDKRVQGPVFSSSGQQRETSSSSFSSIGRVRGATSSRPSLLGGSDVLLDSNSAFTARLSVDELSEHDVDEAESVNTSEVVASYPVAFKEATKAVQSLRKTIFECLNRPYSADLNSSNNSKAGIATELYVSISNLRQGIDLLIRERKLMTDNTKILEFQHKAAVNNDAKIIESLHERIASLVREVESLQKRHQNSSSDAKFELLSLQHELQILKEKNNELSSEIIVKNRTITDQLSALLAVPRVEEGYLKAAKSIVRKRELALVEKTKAMRRIQTDVVNVEYWRNLCHGRQDEIILLESRIKELERHNLSILRLYHDLVNETNRKGDPPLSQSSGRNKSPGGVRPHSASASAKVRFDIASNCDDNNNNNNNDSFTMKPAAATGANENQADKDKASKDILKMMQKNIMLERKVVELSRQLARARSAPLLTVQDPFASSPEAAELNGAIQNGKKDNAAFELDTNRVRGKSLSEIKAQVDKEIDWRSILRDYLDDDSDDDGEDMQEEDYDKDRDHLQQVDHEGGYDALAGYNADVGNGGNRRPKDSKERLKGTIDDEVLEESLRSKVAERVTRSYRDRILNSRATTTTEQATIRKSKSFSAK